MEISDKKLKSGHVWAIILMLWGKKASTETAYEKVHVLVVCILCQYYSFVFPEVVLIVKKLNKWKKIHFL